MAGLVYYLGVAALITHELDAVMQFEWRLLYVLRDLTDEAAHPLFVALHLQGGSLSSALPFHRYWVLLLTALALGACTTTSTPPRADIHNAGAAPQRAACGFWHLPAPELAGEARRCRARSC